MKRLALLVSLFIVGTTAFKCSPDSILTWASDKRSKQLERECHLEKDSDSEPCATKGDLEKAWKDFTDISVEYEKAVKDCRADVAAHANGKMKRHSDRDRLQFDRVIEDQGRHHGRRHADHDPNDPNIDHSGHNHKRRAVEEGTAAKTDDEEEKSSGDCEGSCTINIGGTNTGKRRRDVPDSDDKGETNAGGVSDSDDKGETNGCDDGSCAIDLTDVSSKKRRSSDHDPNDPDIDHSGHNHKRRHLRSRKVKRECGCKLAFKRKLDEAAKLKSKAKLLSEIMAESDEEDDEHTHEQHHDHKEHDKKNHGKDRHQADDPMDDTIDHTGHNHKRRHVDHDPNDPNVDHSGHNHKRRHADHDPNDPNVDHSGHNHKRRDADHDPNDPNVDHSGHNHKRRRHIHAENRAKRQVCMNKGREELDKVENKYKDHCARDNICLPDEDLPQAKAEKFKTLHKLRAKKYAAYIGQVSMCYGKL